MSNFPIDVIADILSRLPVKPLLRFRCVSKPWCALIDDHDFIKLHLNRSIKTKNNLSLILRDCTISSVNFDSLDNAVELDHPLKCSHFGTEVLGSCDGLVCLFNGEEDICIWNPSTRKHQKLPITTIEFPDYFTSCQYIIYGFGYDSINDDYKLVRIVQFYGEDWDSFDSEVKVYSLKLNSWRRIQDFPYYLRYKRGYGELVSSALHWVVSRKFESDTANLVAAFDLADEKYRLVPQPEFSDKDFHMNVGELEGCLCILCNYYQVRVDVWVMKDYGVKESWSKLFSVAQPEVISSFEFVTPLAYSKSGSDVLLVQDNKKLIWYDLERKTVKNINIGGLPKYFESAICVESLVPLKEGGETDGKKQNKQEKKKRKNRKKSLKLNSWRRIQDFPYYLRYKRGYGELVGSALHRVVSRKFESDTANLVAAFDLADENYPLVPQPEFSDKDFHMNVGELEGRLCILCNYYQVGVDVWVMKDYGVKESWSKLFSIAQPEVISAFEFVTPSAYSKSGSDDLLVQNNEKLIWYDLERKTVKNINIRGVPKYFESAICLKSLVALKEGGETDGKKQNKREKKKRKNRKKRDDFLSKGFKLVL